MPPQEAPKPIKWACAHRGFGVFAGSEGAFGAHLSNEQAAAAQRFPHGAQTLHHSRARHRVGVDYVGPGRDPVQTPLWWTDGVSSGSVSQGEKKQPLSRKCQSPDTPGYSKVT